jgi:hypothetical protein
MGESFSKRGAPGSGASEVAQSAVSGSRADKICQKKSREPETKNVLGGEVLSDTFEHGRSHPQGSFPKLPGSKGAATGKGGTSRQSCSEK